MRRDEDQSWTKGWDWFSFFSTFLMNDKLWKWANREFSVAVHRRANSMCALFTHTAKE
jgi:hypothetical protein